MTKTLFLDFDGVLHANTATKDQLFNKSFLLEDLMQQSTFDIVVSSTWRSFYKRHELLALLPPTVAQNVVGITGKDSMTRLGRYHEIVAYCDLHAISNPQAWCALDDSVIEFPVGCPQLIACNPATGITPLEIEKLKAWLLS